MCGNKTNCNIGLLTALRDKMFIRISPDIWLHCAINQHFTSSPLFHHPPSIGKQIRAIHSLAQVDSLYNGVTKPESEVQIAKPKNNLQV